MRIVPLALAAALAGSTAFAEPPRIVTDMGVTASLAQMVLGDLGEVTPLLDPGGDPHHFQLRPSQARALQSADLLIWMGPELTPWLSRAASHAQAPKMALLHQEGTQLLHYGETTPHIHGPGHDDTEHQAPDDHPDEAHDHDSHDDHDHGGVDPHGWLDPDNGRLWLELIARRAAEIDSGNAEIYAANAAKAQETLAELDAQLSADLAPLQGESFAVFHDAYGYFTTHFGLKPAIAVALGDATNPSDARLSEVRESLAESGASCAFPEVGHPPAMIAQLVSGTDMRLGEALSPTGSDLTQGPELYPQLLKEMAARLSACVLTDPK